ncbi:MAG: stress protein [Candidatus Electrothrix sp. MAN1_4]|nr:stress protein [Candidatus Electrothrix sp. MAN1_4]
MDSSPKKSKNDSEFHICLEKIPKEVSKIAFVINIYQAVERQQNFSMVDQISLKIFEKDFNGTELVRYDSKGIIQDIALILGGIYRNKGAWNFGAIGQGFNGGLDLLASRFGVSIEGTSEEDTQVVDEKKIKQGKRSIAQILSQKAHSLQQSIDAFLPQINSAVEQKINESNTRMILDKMFMDAFGYEIDEIKAEQKIQGRRADYILSVDNEDMLVVEAKKAGMRLQNKHIFQATSYGAYSGIKWALLTNLQTWQLYYISTQEKIEENLVFSIDLTTDLTLEDFEKLILISRYGISKKRMLEKLWNEVNALRPENIISTILSEEVINKIRIIIKRDTGCNLANDKIQQTIEEVLRIN